MTPREAAEEMEKRFPDQTFVCSEDVWDKGSKYNNRCQISYGFDERNCQQIQSSTFEECFKLLDKKLTHQQLLLKQF